MISEGPSLIEALPGELQNALNSALRPGEELIIAVRGNQKEAFAATPERMLLLKEPVISGTAPVEVRELPLREASGFRSSPRPVGGRLSWDTRVSGAPTFIDYPTYEASKYSLVAQRLQQMSGSVPSSSPTASAGAATGAVAASRTCPKCASLVPGEGAWCPNCGLQVSDPCWSCGSPLADGANFCTRCGTPNSEPAVVSCPQCKAPVARGWGYCVACGTQARPVCEECDRPMRKDWAHCPECGGGPVWEAAGIRTEVAHLRGDEPEDPSAWLRTAPRTDDGADRNAAGIRAYEAENYQEAVRLFREAIAADGSNASYYTNLGVAYGELGDDLQAFTAYRRAVELNPKELQAYLNMGYLYNERERYAEAREMWEKVVQVAPGSEEAGEARDNLRSMGEV